MEAEVLGWIEAVLGERLPTGAFEEVLRDGTILCRLMNKLQPGAIPKINTSGGQFKMMENINKFQKAMKEYGVPDIDCFQTVDLYERRNIPQVTQSICALGRTVSSFPLGISTNFITFPLPSLLHSQCYLHPEWPGPFLGPKPADENKRNFSSEQLRAGEGVINLQYGTNKGANASGMNFGNTRHM